MQAINYTECYVVNRLVGLAQFCRIQPKQLYVINTCICNVVEAVEVEAKLHITVEAKRMCSLAVIIKLLHIIRLHCV